MANQTSAKDEISLKELLDKLRELYFFLLSKWKVIAIAGILGACLGLAYSFIKKPVYTATLSFALEGEGGGGAGGMLGFASQFGLDLGGGGGSIFEGSNLIELFKSRNMVEQTLMKPTVYNGISMSFAEMYIQINKWREKWENKPKFAKIQFLPDTKRKYFTRVHDSILGVIYNDISKNNLTVGQRDKKVDIISLDISTTNEQFSKEFCEALAKQVGDFYVTTKSKKAIINLEILEKQTDSIRKELNNAITNVAIANDNNFSLNPALFVRRTPSSKIQVDVQANTAILTELVKQTEISKVSLRKATPLIQVIDRPMFPLQKVSFGKAKGIVLGGFLFQIVVIFGLIIRKFLINSLN